MKIKEISENKKAYFNLLLIGDEDEKMIDKYITEGILYIGFEGDIAVSAAVVLQKDGETIEIKNLATYPEYQKRGYASLMLDYICDKYKTGFRYMILGTGENEQTLDFYKKRGFVETHRVSNFFTENYSHPIYENGVQLVDLIYLKKLL